MISPKEIKDKASKKYKEFLKYEIDLLFNKPVEPFFPLVIKGDTGNVNDDLFKRQNELQFLIKNSKNETGSGYYLELENVNSRKNGIQTDIKKILLECKEDYLSFIKEDESYCSFLSGFKIVKEKSDVSEQFLYDWVCVHISDLCKKLDNNFWSDICLCANWLDSNLNTNLYIREIPIPVHTKFIENNKSLIKSLTKKFDSELSFEETYGLKSKPILIRIRSLDEKKQFMNISLSECSITVSDLNNIDESFYNGITNVFIVENEMIFLTFPKVDNAICIWGHGFTVNALKDVNWLKNKNIIYFGDIDEHGFEILSSLRGHFSKTQSFCMSKTILEKYDGFRVEGAQLKGLIIPKHLSEHELEVFIILRNGPKNKNRLEQERIDNQTICLEINRYFGKNI